MRSYAIPCIISLLVASLYNIVDQIFIANATYLGSGAHDDAYRSIGCSVILCIIVSLVVTAAYLVFDDPILTMFDGSPRFAMAATVSGLWLT